MFVHFEAQHAVKKVHDLKILQLNKNREHNRVSFETLSLLVFSEAAVFLNFNWVTTPTRSSSTLWLIPAREVLGFFYFLFYYLVRSQYTLCCVSEQLVFQLKENIYVVFESLSIQISQIGDVFNSVYTWWNTTPI